MSCADVRAAGPLSDDAAMLFSTDPRSDVEGLSLLYRFVRKPFGRHEVTRYIDKAFALAIEKQTYRVAGSSTSRQPHTRRKKLRYIPANHRTHTSDGFRGNRENSSVAGRFRDRSVLVLRARTRRNKSKKSKRISDLYTQFVFWLEPDRLGHCIETGMRCNAKSACPVTHHETARCQLMLPDEQVNRIAHSGGAGIN